MKKKNYSAQFAAFLFLIIFLLSIFTGCGAKLIKEPEDLTLTRVKYRTPYYFPERSDFGELNDGIFYGEVSLNPYDFARVKITVKNNRISDFKILDLKATWWVRRKGLHLKIFYNLPTAFILAQSPHVDTVTGASGSCHSLKIAFTRALWNAAGKEDPMTEYLPEEK
ncbi:hypothetical protein ACFL2X_01420 [Candidatus Latescibacterota bacterium]